MFFLKKFLSLVAPHPDLVAMLRNFLPVGDSRELANSIVTCILAQVGLGWTPETEFLDGAEGET
jgi:hypothetical protein